MKQYFLLPCGIARKILVALPVSLICLFCHSQVIEPDYLKQNKIAGKVKQLAEITADARHVFTFNEKGLQTGRWFLSPPDVLISRQSAAYNDSGQITEEIVYDKGIAPVQKKVYAYDSKGTPLGRSFFGHNGALLEKFIYVHTRGKMTDSIKLDSYGNQVEKHSWQYDVRGNRTREILLKNADSSTVNSSYDYNAFGKLVRKTVKHSANSKLDYALYYTYDSLGNITSEYTHYRDGISDYKKEYKFDSLGSKTEFIHYSASGKIVEMFLYKYDALKRLAEENKYDTSGQLISRTTHAYDEKNNETALTLYLPSGKPDVEVTWQYEYDKAGNWTSKKQFVHGTLTAEIKREIEYYAK